MGYAVCLGCGGAVDEGEGVPEGVARCSCPPPSVAAGHVACPGCGGSLRVGARACPYCRATLATCRCPVCSAWNLAEARHCQACGRTLGGGHDGPESQTGRPCPRCGAALVARRYGELDVDECDSCGGLMVTPDTMDRLVSARDACTNLRLALPERRAAPEPPVRYLRCPGCGKTMNRKAFGRISGVVVDVCRPHGVWFDAGELSQVLAFVARGGLEVARQKEAEELVESVRRARHDQMRAAFSGGLTQAAALDGQTTLRRAEAGSEILLALASLWD